MSDPSTSQTTLSAQEAAAYLGVTPATLYSYVSRGLVHSEAAPGTRTRRYRVADLDRLRQRRAQRSDPSVVAATALDFGQPVLASSLCLIEGGELYYRGQSAVDLAHTATFAEVAALLWTGERSPLSFPPLPAFWRESLALFPAHAHPVELLLSLLTLLHAQDPAGRDPSPETVIRTGQHTMQTLVFLAGATAETTSFPAALADTWGLHYRYTKILDLTLILLADHELNISSFTARCVASTGASTYLTLAAALAALQGPRHGGQSLQCEAFLREVQWDGIEAIANRLRRGDAIPGFGHPLYPDGDPRARAILAQLEQDAQDTPALITIHAAIDAATQVLGNAPNVDFALAALVHTLQLPAGSSLLLFCLGRLAGWIGHILEQRQTHQLIRPRARYIGPPPQLPLSTQS